MKIKSDGEGNFIFECDGIAVGLLSHCDGTLQFKGDAFRSADVLFEILCSKYNTELCKLKLQLEELKDS